MDGMHLVNPQEPDSVRETVTTCELACSLSWRRGAVVPLVRAAACRLIMAATMRLRL